MNFEGMMATLKSVPAKTIFLLHPCCHNPTGVDLSIEQWKKWLLWLKNATSSPSWTSLTKVSAMASKRTAAAGRMMAEAGVSFFVSSSYSKNLSYYGERAGGLSVVCKDAAEAEVVLGQLKLTVRKKL